MKKNLHSFFILNFILLFSFCHKSSAQKGLFQNDSYLFLHLDTEIDEIRIQNDTLFQYHCTEGVPCPDWRITGSAKIEKTEKNGNIFALTFIVLDSLKRAQNNQKFIVVYRKLDENRIQAFGTYPSNKNGIITVKNLMDSLKMNPDAFAITYYKKSYLDHLSQTMASIKDEKDVDKIKIKSQSQQYEKLITHYQKAIKSGKLSDMYGVGIRSEILTKVCIELGYDPMGAGMKINEIERKRPVDIDLSLSNLPSNPQQLITFRPKVNDPLLYPYKNTKAPAQYFDDFSNSKVQWLELKLEDSLEEKQLISFNKNQLQLKSIDSVNTIARFSQFDFTKNFEFEISIKVPQKFNQKSGGISFCLGLDSIEHNHGLSVYYGRNGKLSLSTPDPSSEDKKWRGTYFYLLKKYRSQNMVFTIRHLDGRFDIFVNDRYVGKLKHAPIFKGDLIHLGNLELKSTAIFNYISIVKL